MDNLSWGNPVAHRVRVHFNSASKVIYEGMPVCYNYDTTVNWAGGSVSDGAVTASTTLTAGSPATAAAKYLEVEVPDSENLQWFAGVVAKGGWVGKTTSSTAGVGQLLDIYVPNGAIVPVRAGIYCYVGVTVLAIQDASQSLEQPIYGTASATVAIAEETVDRATDGLVLAKLLGVNHFSNGTYDIPLRTGDGVTSSTVRVFERDISTRQLTSNIQASCFRTRLKGASAACPDGGAINAEVFTEGQNDSPNNPINALCGNIVFGYGSTLDGSQGNIDAYAVKASLNEAVGYGATRAGSVVTALLCHCALDDASDGRVGQMGFTSGGTGTVDNFLIADNAISVAQNADGGTKDTNDTCALFLEILIGSTTYWIPTYTDAELTA